MKWRVEKYTTEKERILSERGLHYSESRLEEEGERVGGTGVREEEGKGREGWLRGGRGSLVKSCTKNEVRKNEVDLATRI